MEIQILIFFLLLYVRVETQDFRFEGTLRAFTRIDTTGEY